MSRLRHRRLGAKQEVKTSRVQAQLRRHALHFDVAARRVAARSPWPSAVSVSVIVAVLSDVCRVLSVAGCSGGRWSVITALL